MKGWVGPAKHRLARGTAALELEIRGGCGSRRQLRGWALAVVAVLMGCGQPGGKVRSCAGNN